MDLRLLIAEDSEDDAFFLVRQLQRAGFELEHQRVDNADDMQQALEQHWDLVITDHNMPSFDSGRALELVKQSGMDIPVIMVSGSVGEELAVEAMKAGAHDYVMKDNLTRLVPAVERELREAEHRREHRRMQESIHHMAYHDALTDLVNRREFETRLANLLVSATENHNAHALLYLDLDQFKIVNDTCGHVAGDALLREIADCLGGCIRDHDTLARLGGDEFGVLLENCPLAQATHIAEKLRDAVARFQFHWEGKVFNIGVSVGLVPVSAEDDSVEALLSAADMACYAAKDKGRNRVHHFMPDDVDLAQRRGEMRWVSELASAIDDQRFHIFRQQIQPVGEFGQGRQWHELLLRLDDGNGHYVSPAEFIPAAERYNLMPAIDRYVITHVAAELARLYHADTAAFVNSTTFINLSGASLSDDRFLEYLRGLIADRCIPSECVCFEITETAAISNLGPAIEFIQEVRDEGFHVALDDFGTGMCSYEYLRSLPVDFLKIDGSFVTRMLSDPMDHAIVEAVNKIAHVTGIHTIAEFVESQAIQDTLAEIGLDFVQGYHVHRPELMFKPIARDA